VQSDKKEAPNKGKPWLVTGGCGYIGAHILKELHHQNISAEFLDIEYRSGKHKLFPEFKFHTCDIRDKSSLRELFRQQTYEGVIHLAALKSVSESQDNEKEYFETNVVGTGNILELIQEFHVPKMIFSSTAAVYRAESNNHYVSEISPVGATSYYGETKVIAEKLITEAIKESKLNAVIFRYFNVAGASTPSLADHSTVNLIPSVLNKLQTNESPEIFGNDYDTADGTAVRDFIDVRDVVHAHICAMKYMTSEFQSQILNIGTGHGVSVKEVIGLAQEVLKTDINPLYLSRRSGDIGAVVASCTKAEEIIGFKSQFTLRDMIESSIP
jgi:UDP-glucose 4-epimerase